MPNVTHVSAYLWRIEHNNCVYWALSLTHLGHILLQLDANQSNA